MDKRSAQARRQKLRIMPLGDSITEGVGTPGRYRHSSVSSVDQNRAIGLNRVDGLHPNARGDEAMAQTWLGGIEQVLR